MSETPILDLIQPVPDPRRSWSQKLLGVALGLSIVSVLILQDEGYLPAWHWPSFNGLLLIPALYIAIAIHELGHLIAGRLAGFNSGGIAIGGFVLLRSGKNWSFRFDWRSWMAGGYFRPLTDSRTFRRRPFAWLVAGGPLASLALTVLCLLQLVHSGSGMLSWVGTLFWVALFLLIVSAVPFSFGVNRSDGARLVLLFRHWDRAISWMLLLAIQSEEAKGLRPREWNGELFDAATSIDKEASEYPYCQLMAYYRKLDQGDEPAALQHLENALSNSLRSGKPFRHALFVEAASACANLRKQAAQARSWSERATRLQKTESLDVTEAGIAMCEGRYNDALRFWASAKERVARRKLDSGLVRFAKEKWSEYEAVCRLSAQDGSSQERLGRAG